MNWLNYLKQQPRVGARRRLSARPHPAGPIRYLLLVLTLLVSVPIAASSHGASIEGLRLEGETADLFYDWGGGKGLPRHTGRFSLDVDRTGNWLLTASTTANTNGHFVDAFDGTNHYTIVYSSRLPKAPSSTTLNLPGPAEQDTNTASVSLGPYPSDLWPGERIVWFALASGPYQADPGSRKMPAPWRNTRLEPQSYSFTNTLQQDPAWPRSPLSAEFFTAVEPSPAEQTNLPLLNRGKLSTNRSPERQKVRAPKPGQLAARYTVERSTNMWGAQIPLAYRLEVFWPGFGVDTSDRSIAELHTGTVTNIARIDSSVGRPRIVGNLSVEDYRPPHRTSGFPSDPLRYRITNHVWREMTEKGIQVGAHKPKTSAPRTNTPVARALQSVLLFVLVAGVALVPLVLYRRHRE